MSEPAMSYFIGCPVWASASWVGKVFSPAARREQWLGQYSSAFNAVEGNSTFYGLPRKETVERWAADTAAGFRFALKFPQAISHVRQLVDAETETAEFLNLLHVLRTADRLGPAFLQLPPQFSAQQLPVLERYLQSLPRDFQYAVEVRHRSLFDEGAAEAKLDSILTEFGINRVLYDSRPLFAYPPEDDFEEKAQRQKPRSPLRRTVTGPQPMLRIIGRNDVSACDRWLEDWATIVAGWIQQGLTPYVFTHAPNDFYCPDLARRFHDALRVHLPALPHLPPWPGETLSAPAAVQGRLF